MDRSELPLSGWGFVAAAALAMGTAGIYQFGWSSIRLPVGARLGVAEPALGTVFTLFVVFQTLGQFPAGWVRDRYGPRLPLLVGAACMAGGFGLVAVADSLPVVYAAYILGGVGVSSTYTVAVNTAVKWFSARRGLASGIVTMAYSGLSFAAIPVIRGQIETGFQATLLVLAVLAGLASLLAAVVLRDPERADTDDPTTDTATDRAWGWRQAIRTWQFWLLYLVFVLVNGVGLMLIGKIVSFAGVLSFPESIATASASVVALADAGGVLLGGSLSDRLGRRRTTAGSLLCCGLALAGAVFLGQRGHPLGFLGLIAAAALFRSPPFSVFPAMVGEFYGKRYSSENYAALYTGKLFGGVFGGTVASALVVSLGWSESFLLGAGAVMLAGVLLLFLRPVETASESATNAASEA
ncbi:MFS transporter [Halorientalis marina]|jgi:OFA family oxalate/formate antiporter-like MFS transporter|uniref:MFS transporter n=1 Tax=Halorientalis marina TaxID=2931976 RepID=UPI001FF2CC68|nr:MFS transporter [Halorientalis marina]